MKQTNDPREFRDLSDNPTNDGNGIESRDWEEIRPQGIVRNMYDENEEEENPDKDDFDSGDWGERFD